MRGVGAQLFFKHIEGILQGPHTFDQVASRPAAAPVSPNPAGRRLLLLPPASLAPPSAPASLLAHCFSLCDLRPKTVCQ